MRGDSISNRPRVIAHFVVAYGHQEFAVGAVLPDHLSLAVGEEQEGDQVITRGDRTVLLVDQEISGTLAGAVLDAGESPDGTRLTLRPADTE